MTWQNRIVLDVCWLKRVGVYGGSLDADDTAPDGSVTKALAGLHTLAHELAVNSGVDTSLTN